MGNIILIGGMGTGKTTLVDTLKQQYPEMHHIYWSKYAVRIPLTLIANGHDDLLSLPKARYIDTILEHQDIPISPTLFRPTMDEYCERVTETFGDEFFGELALALIVQDTPNLVENMAKRANVRYLRERGFYIVGLDCPFETQVERRWKQKRDVDSYESIEELATQIAINNRFLEIPESLEFAHVIYNTEDRRSDSPDIITYLVQILKGQ